MIGIGANLKFQPNVTAYATGAALEYYFAERETDAPFGTNPITLTNSTVAGTCTRFNDQGVMETLSSRPTPRIDYDPTTIAYQNTLLQSANLSLSPWIPGTGGFYTAIQSSDIANPAGKNEHVTKFTRAISGGDRLFARQSGLSMSAGLRTGSIYVFVPAQGGVTNWKFYADWGDVDTGTGSTETTFGAWIRVSSAATLAATRSFLDCNIMVNGGDAPVGFYFYACWVQENSGALLPYKHASTVALTKYACRGQLHEPAATNSIRNNTMVGAVAGTPGTLPTNWTSSGNAGLARQVVGIGTEDGIDYIDVRYSGTVAAVGSPEQYVVFDGANVIAASSGQTWTSSFYSRVVGGSLTGVVNCENFIVCHDGASALTEATSATFTPNSSALKSNRSTHTRTLTAGSTQYIHNRVDLNFTAGATVDVTLRIGMPQLERDRVTSVIPTSGSAVTRAADIPVTAALAGLALSTHTVVVKYRLLSMPSVAEVVAIHDGTSNNYAAMRIGSLLGGSPGGNDLYINSGGVNQADTTGAVLQVGVAYKSAYRVAANSAALYNSGAQVGSDASVTLPVNVNKLVLSGGGFHGCIEYVGIHNRPATNAELVQMSV